VTLNYFDQLVTGKSPSELEKISAEATAQLEPNPGQWLPLPHALANSFPWVLDAPGAESVPLHKLADTAVVKALDKRLRNAYEDAIRRRLREPLAQGTLPRALLESPVRDEAVSEVRGHLSRHGTPRNLQPDFLRIIDAIDFIGRRPNRLLQCTSKAAEGPPPATSPDALEFVMVNAKLLGLGPGEKLGPAFRKVERISKNPFSLSHPLQVPDRWRKLRGNANGAVSILLEDGEIVTARDPRFGWALMRIHGFVHLAGQPVAAVEQRVKQIGNESLRETWQWLADGIRAAQAATTENETRALIQSLLPRSEEKQSAADILAGRYGLSGRDMTLEECGTAMGLTRERVRQLQAAFEKVFADSRPYAPALLRFARNLEKFELISIRRLGEGLAPTLGGQTSLGALAAARAVLGKPEQGWVFDGVLYPPYGLRISCWSRRLAQPDLLAILRSARSMTGRVGAFHVTAVCADVSEELKAYISRAEVEAAVDSCEQFCWLDRDSGWGSLAGVGDAPIFNEVRKMLAVAYPISLDITDICAGLAACRRQVVNRDSASRFGGGMPPPWVMRQLLEQQPDLQVAQYDNFKLKVGVDPLSLIEGDAEKVIFKTLVRLGGVAAWKELRQELVHAEVMNPITFAVVLKSSSIFCQPGYGIYALRGWRFNIEAIWGKHGQKTFPRPVAQSSLSVGHSADVIEMDVNQTAITTTKRSGRAVYVPAAALPRAVGTYLHQDTPGLRIRISSRGQVARLAQELRDNGVQPKETVRLALNTVARTYCWRPKA